MWTDESHELTSSNSEELQTHSQKSWNNRGEYGDERYMNVKVTFGIMNVGIAIEFL